MRPERRISDYEYEFEYSEDQLKRKGDRHDLDEYGITTRAVLVAQAHIVYTIDEHFAGLRKISDVQTGEYRN